MGRAVCAKANGAKDEGAERHPSQTRRDVPRAHPRAAWPRGGHTGRCTLATRVGAYLAARVVRDLDLGLAVGELGHRALGEVDAQVLADLERQARVRVPSEHDDLVHNILCRVNKVTVIYNFDIWLFEINCIQKRKQFL